MTVLHFLDLWNCKNLPKRFFQFFCDLIACDFQVGAFGLSLRWYRATGENRPTSLWESQMTLTWCWIRPSGDLFLPFTVLICMSFTDRHWSVGCVICILLFLSFLLYWGRNDAGTVPWKFYLHLKVCKLIFSTCSKTWVLYGWCKDLAIQEIIAVYVNMEENVVVVYAWIHVNVWKFM